MSRRQGEAGGVKRPSGKAGGSGNHLLGRVPDLKRALEQEDVQRMRMVWSHDVVRHSSPYLVHMQQREALLEGSFSNVMQYTINHHL